MVLQVQERHGAWYSGSCGGTSEGPGTYIIVNPSITTIYYLRAEGMCNTTNCVSINITVNINSIPADSLTATVHLLCSGASSTLAISGGSLGTGSSWNWYSGTCGGAFIATGSYIVVSPALTTTYFARAEGMCNTTICSSRIISINTVSSPASSATATNSTICSGATTTLGISGGVLGTGANWYWFSNSCGGSLAGSGILKAVSPTATTVYFVRAQGTCNTTICLSEVIIVNTPSVIPDSITASQAFIYPGSTITLSISGGLLGTSGSWNWYSGSCGGISQGTGQNIAVTPLTNITYFARAEGTCNSTGCVIKPITAYDTSISALAITSTNDSICLGSSVTLGITGGSLGYGAGWFWYSGICGGSSIGSGITIVVNPTITSSYYVRVAGYCNTTPCVMHTIVVVVPPIPVMSNNSPVCYGDTLKLSCTGGILYS